MSDQMQRQIRLRGVRSGKMSTDEEAANAITKFNGMDFNGRSLTITEARPIVRRDGGVGRSRRFWGRTGSRQVWGRTKPMVSSECLFHERTRNGQECSAYGAKARERKSAARTAKGKGTTSR